MLDERRRARACADARADGSAASTATMRSNRSGVKSSFGSPPPTLVTPKSTSRLRTSSSTRSATASRIPIDDAGIAPREARDRRGKQFRRYRRQRGDRHAPRVARRDVVRALEQRTEIGEHLRDDREQVLARLRQPHRARVAVEQAHVERNLELADARRQRGLRAVEQRGCLREALEPADGDERAHLPHAYVAFRVSVHAIKD